MTGGVGDDRDDALHLYMLEPSRMMGAVSALVLPLLPMVRTGLHIASEAMLRASARPCGRSGGARNPFFSNNAETRDSDAFIPRSGALRRAAREPHHPFVVLPGANGRTPATHPDRVNFVNFARPLGGARRR